MTFVSTIDQQVKYVLENLAEKWLKKKANSNSFALF